MSYIGNQPSPLPQTLAVRSDVFSANGTQTTFTLTYPVYSNIDVEVVVGNTQLSPHTGAYTASGTTLTITPAVSAGSNNVYVIYRNYFQVAPTIGTSTILSEYIAPLAVTTAKIADSAVTTDKMANTLTLGTLTVSGVVTAANNIVLNREARAANHAVQKKYVDALTIVFGA